MGGEFLEGEFFWGPLLLKKNSQNIRPKNSGPKFGRPKFVSQNSGLNSGSGGAKSPAQTFVPDFLPLSRAGSALECAGFEFFVVCPFGCLSANFGVLRNWMQLFLGD